MAREDYEISDRPMSNFMRRPYTFSLAGIAIYLALASLAQAHPGRTNAQGCHAGSQPYHCHNSSEVSSTASATVISVGDGDTLRATYQGQNTTIRLACIDAPETAQTPWGAISRDRLKQLLSPGLSILVREVDRDRCGRVVAEIFANGQLVNLQMVQEGYAVAYQQYLTNCPNNRIALLDAESQARQAQRNFWSQQYPVMPWDFRRAN